MQGLGFRCFLFVFFLVVHEGFESLWFTVQVKL